ncbi:MAG: response regulator [Gemmatimonadetes bacterium]|nr:response regulator [Gemmatimonadota bacterium]
MARILVVDDEPDFRRIVSRMLTGAGYDVEEAADGRQAIEAYRARRSDVVLADLYMPDIDGVEAIIRLRHEFPDVRIIAVSGGGHLGKEDVLKIAAGVGAQATLAKPLEKKTLLATVEQVLGDR